MDISLEQARAQWFLRNGNGNPEHVDIKFWEYMVRSRHGANWARNKFKKIGGNASGGESSKRYTEPVWCFTRNGRTVTPLKDGRIIYTGGEHEDWYDSDFCIYNDVIVEDTNGGIDIYIYPDDIFPPTDFHTATLVGSDLYLIGSLGYNELRWPGETQVLKLDLNFFSISSLETFGECPGWINKHDAEYVKANGEIVVSGGQVLNIQDGATSLDELVGRYSLNMSDLTWRRVD